MTHVIQSTLTMLRAGEWIPVTAARVLIGMFFDLLYLPEVLCELILVWLIFSGPSRFSVDGDIASRIGLFGVERSCPCGANEANADQP